MTMIQYKGKLYSPFTPLPAHELTSLSVVSAEHLSSPNGRMPDIALPLAKKLPGKNDKMPAWRTSQTSVRYVQRSLTRRVADVVRDTVQPNAKRQPRKDGSARNKDGAHEE